MLLIGAVGVWLTYQALASSRRSSSPANAWSVRNHDLFHRVGRAVLQLPRAPPLRRNVINRSAFVGSAVAVGAGLDLP